MSEVEVSHKQSDASRSRWDSASQLIGDWLARKAVDRASGRDPLSDSPTGQLPKGLGRCMLVSCFTRHDESLVKLPSLHQKGYFVIMRSMREPLRSCGHEVLLTAASDHTSHNDIIVQRATHH